MQRKAAIERERAEYQLRDILRAWLLRDLLAVLPDGGLRRAAEAVAGRDTDPYTAATQLMATRDI